MTRIQLQTIIKAPMQIVFDLARNIDVHQQSAVSSQEKAIAGVTFGLIGLNETVTWRGKHFGLYLQHQSKITQMERPFHFTDQMIKGHFKSFCHHHYFEEANGITFMIDQLSYETPYGLIGQWFDRICLKKHLTNFLKKRNETLKFMAEQSAS